MVHNSSAICASAISVVRGARAVLTDVTFDVALGSTTALLGPNGAGKTTTLDVLCGQITPTTGRAMVLERDPTSDWAALSQDVGVMTQHGGIYLSMTPHQATSLFGSYYRTPLNPNEVLRRVGLNEQACRTPWRRLSGGEKQRLNLALALVGNPKMLLLDEPTAGLDPSGQESLRLLLRELQQSDVTILLTTHDLDDAETLADKVVVIDQGSVAYVGPTTDPARNTRVVATCVSIVTHAQTQALQQSFANVDAIIAVNDTNIEVATADAAMAQHVVATLAAALQPVGLVASQVQVRGGRLRDIYNEAVKS